MQDNDVPAQAIGLVERPQPHIMEQSLQDVPEAQQ